MKNLLKYTGGIAFAALVFTANIAEANANTTAVDVDNISIVNEDVSTIMKESLWILVSEDYVLGGVH